MFNTPTVFTDPSGQIVPLLIFVGVGITLAGVGGTIWATSRYEYAMERYLSLPLDQWTPELEAEFHSYVGNTDWIAAVSEVAGWTGMYITAAPYVGYWAGHWWAAGGIRQIVVVSLAAAGIIHSGYDAITIIGDWDLMEGPERFRRVGYVVGPMLAMLVCGPRYFNLGRSAVAFNPANFVGRQAVTPPHLPAGVYPALVIDGRVYVARFHNVAWELAGRTGNVQFYGLAEIDAAGRVVRLIR